MSDTKVSERIAKDLLAQYGLQLHGLSKDEQASVMAAAAVISGSLGITGKELTALFSERRASQRHN